MPKLRSPSLRTVRSYNKPTVRMPKIPTTPSLTHMMRMSYNNKTKNINRKYARRKVV